MNGTYLNIDCMELMATLPDKSIDLAIVDPPYGIGADKEKYTPINITWQSKKRVGYKSKEWDSFIPNDKYFTELFRVSKNQIIWGGNYFGLIGGYIFWNKKETMPTYTKGELAYCSSINKIDYFEYLWSGYKKEIPEERIHPTQKPVKLYEWLLTNYAKPNDLILDTHVGSASSLIACENLGFKYIASELDKDYYSQSLQRLQNHLAQGKLFQRQGANEIMPQKGLFE